MKNYYLINSNTEYMSRKAEENYSVPGLDKGLAIIEAIAASSKGMTMVDITSMVDVTSTTAYRILSTLLRRGYVLYDESKKSYILSRKILQIGYTTLGEHDLLEIVLPAIRNLRDEVKESVFFGVLGSEKGIFIEQAQSNHPFKFILEKGTSFELHNSAPGKVFMAYSTLAERSRYLGLMRFEKCTHKTITTQSKYVKELSNVLSLGYAIDDEESLIGVVCVSAPILDFENRAIGAIWVSGPSSRLCGENMTHTIERLKATAEFVSQRSGYTKQENLCKINMGEI